MAWSAPENHLKNASFERTAPVPQEKTAVSQENGPPAEWNVYLQPQRGAKACRDGLVAFDGDYSVMIHNARPYLSDPCNNWSQNVLGDWAGKELTLRGHIKTEKATEAAIWLQCWRRDPWGVARVATTSDDRLITGTVDWTPVQIKLETPADTDFVTVRCVLKGEGTAWFDDLALEEDNPPRDDKIASFPAEPPKDSTPPPPASDVPPTQPPPPSVGNMSEVNAGTPPATTPSTPDDRQVEEVRQAILDAMDSLRATNESQAAEIAKLRDEIAGLRTQLEKLSASPAPPAPVSRGVPRVPPLVPHGYVVED